MDRAPQSLSNVLFEPSQTAQCGPQVASVTGKMNWLSVVLFSAKNLRKQALKMFVADMVRLESLLIHEFTYIALHKSDLFLYFLSSLFFSLSAFTFLFLCIYLSIHPSIRPCIHAFFSQSITQSIIPISLAI